MTSWPWMKGVGVALADPAPPLNEYDDRPSAKALIAENRGVIEQVKKELQGDSLYDAAKHDELWILRFLLSHKLNTKHAVEAAKTTLAFRKEHRLDEKTAVPIHWLKIVQIKSCGSIKHTAKTARSSCLSQTRGEVSSAFCIGHLAAGTGLRERVFVSVGPCDHWPHDEIREIGGLQGLFHVANLIRVPQAQRRA